VEGFEKSAPLSFGILETEIKIVYLGYKLKKNQCTQQKKSTECQLKNWRN
jgi:hypothetical protein